MKSIDPGDASILGVIADHAVGRKSDLSPEEAKALLERIRNEDAKAIAVYFVKGTKRRPAFKKAADELRAWAQRNRTVHSSTSG